MRYAYRSRTYLLALFLSLAALLSACRTATPAPTPTPPPTLAPSPSSPSVQEACNLSLQVKAMRADQVPDWESIGLPACYELRFELAPESGRYRGQAHLTFHNQTGTTLPDLVLRTYPNAPVIFGGVLQVTAARLDGRPLTAETFLDDATALRLPLPEPLAPGETLQVDLEFEGQVPADYGGLPDVYGLFNYDRQLQVLTLANAYPLLAVWQDGAWQAGEVIWVGDAVVSDSALYQVEVTAPLGWQVVTTGSEVSMTESSQGVTSTFTSGPAREFMILASPNFTVRQDRQAGTTIQHWGLPGGEDRWEEALEATRDSLAIFNDRFGAYPYAELDVVAAPMKNAAGVEYPGVFLIRDQLYEPNAERPFFLGLVAAHETAHQWWYGTVGNDVLAHPWQDEALTTFSSSLYQAAHQPQFYAGTLQAYQTTVDEIEARFQDQDLGIGQSSADFQDRLNLYGAVVYNKGTLFFQALRQRLGDEVFFDALQTYYRDFTYRRAEKDDLLAAFETGCACSLDDIYEAWGVVR